MKPLWRLLPACGLLLVSAASGTEQDRRLSGPEIAARFAGRELTDEVHWSYVFDRDGTIRSVALGRPGSGTWRVDGDRLCTTGGPGSAPCHEVWAAGSGVQLRRDDAPPEDGVLKPARRRDR